MKHSVFSASKTQITHQGSARPQLMNALTPRTIQLGTTPVVSMTTNAPVRIDDFLHGSGVCHLIGHFRRIKYLQQK
jgi:hypothetical protein